MKVKYVLTWLSIAALSAAGQVRAAEEVVMDETFEGDFSQWSKPLGKPRVEDGKLILELKQGANGEGKYNNVGLQSLNNEKLSFFRNPVTIDFSDIVMGGSAKGENYFFDFWLGTESGMNPLQKARFHFYVKGNGALRVQLYVRADPNKPAELRPPIEMEVSLPIKKLTIDLDAEGMALNVEDAGGKQTKDVKWGQFFRSELLNVWRDAWTNAEPAILLKLTEANDTGSSEAALGNLKITSKAP